MRVITLPEFGSALELIEIDTPQPLAGEVRVRVHAASVNGFDLAVAAGSLDGLLEHRFPVVLGKDFAGVVDALGEGVTDYEVGDRVFGVVTKTHVGDGSFGEFVTVPTATGLAKLPVEVDFARGAALGLAGTAAQAAVDAAELTEGSTVLIVGATGGVGNQAVQLAVAAGATVIATARTALGIAQVRMLGATEIVDHTQNISQAVRTLHTDGVDVVLHFAGDAATVLPALRSGGRFVSTLIASPEQLSVVDAVVVPIYADPTPVVLGRLADSLAAGRTSVTVQGSYALADVADAFEAFSDGARGKLVILPSPLSPSANRELSPKNPEFLGLFSRFAGWGGVRAGETRVDASNLYAPEPSFCVPGPSTGTSSGWPCLPSAPSWPNRCSCWPTRPWSGTWAPCRWPGSGWPARCCRRSSG
ncbi:NADP-dependent oxidoreductase [Cryobacterium sp. PAMC25264]|uniref:NADP-dependent oxidoreductase n=1 Tax=Cryobacterium sp. PAMC25264 TaxID=2861288 RepID=UPI002103829C|nr:NADP-dependent oxidoreductase [Cryobacterium sp. PAMC25264]